MAGEVLRYCFQNTDSSEYRAGIHEYRAGMEYPLGIVEYFSRPVYQWNTGPVFYQSGLSADGFGEAKLPSTHVIAEWVRTPQEDL